MASADQSSAPPLKAVSATDHSGWIVVTTNTLVIISVGVTATRLVMRRQVARSLASSDWLISISTVPADPAPLCPLLR